MTKRFSLSKIEKIRKVASECQCAKIDGSMLDAYSASAIVAVYDRLSDENRIKFLGLPIPRMASLAFKLCG